MTDDDGSIKSSIAELPPIFEVVVRKKKRERPIEDDTMMGGADMEDDLSEKAFRQLSVFGLCSTLLLLSKCTLGI